MHEADDTELAEDRNRVAGVAVEGPAPELTDAVRDLQRRCHRRRQA